MTAQWDVWPRGADLTRNGDPVHWWTELVHVKRYGLPNTWTLTGPPAGLLPFTPGMGCILDRDGVQVDSGTVRDVWRTRRFDATTGRVEDEVTLAFTSDKDVLWSRLLYPDPAHDLTGTMSKFSRSHDTRTGSREAILLGYIGANLGPSAPIVRRRLDSLLVPASAGRGGSTSYKARMNVLGDVVVELAEAGNLIVDVQHDESTGVPRLALSVDSAPDVSADVVFGPQEVARATAPIVELEYRIQAPELTDAVVFSAGEETARDAARFSDEAAVSLWGMRREVLVDQRQTDDPQQVTDAGLQALEDGASPVSASFTVAASADVQVGREFDTGWRVGIEIPELPAGWVLDNRVREITTTVNRDSPERHDIVVGTPGASANSTRQAQVLARALRRIAQLERGR